MLRYQHKVKRKIARGGTVNFIRWEAGNVLPDTGRAMEHMASFDYGYRIAAIRDWLPAVARPPEAHRRGEALAPNEPADKRTDAAVA